jgi:acyl-CoA reductase-like NAD-dependent aldehyde dehydrogenase
MKLERGMLIGGEWLDAGDGSFPVIEKHSGETLAMLPAAGVEQIEAALASARDAFREWGRTPAHERAAILARAADAISDEAEGLATLICREAGKAWRYSLGEVKRAVETFRFAAEEAKRIHGETVPMDASAAGEGRLGFYLRTPIGVVVAITPFNFPLNLVAHKLAPALAAANTVVLKPAHATPLTAIRLGTLLERAGLPPGVLNIVQGAGGRVGEALVRHPIPGKVSFTGSPPVGERILSIAGLKKVTLELGNNSGTLIEPDANLEQAVPRCVVSAFANSGQVCISLQRLLVHEAIAEEVTQRLLAATDALKVGDPIERDCDVGPMISDSAAERAESWVQEAVAQGARLLRGGRREGRLMWPCLLADTQPEMKVECEEAFAPLLCLSTYRSFEEGLSRLAETQYGLQAGIYTRDLGKAFRAVERIDAGGVMVNDTSIFRVDHMPYGGNRRSGIGREGVRFAIEEMTNIRMVCFNLS